METFILSTYFGAFRLFNLTAPTFRVFFCNKMFKTFAFLNLYIIVVTSFPDPGQWSASYVKVKSALFGIHKPLYSGSNIYISVNCEPHSFHQKVTLQWVIRQTSCYEDYLASDINNPQILNQYYICPMSTNYFPKIRFYVSDVIELECSNRIHLDFVNASYVTYSDNLEIPPECENRNMLTTMPIISLQKFLNDTTSDYDNTITQLNSTHSRTKRSPAIKNAQNMNLNVTELPRLLTTTQLHGKNNSKALKFSNKTQAKQKVNFARFHNNNETLPTRSSYGYVSSPFTSNGDVKLGAKLTSVDMDGIYLFIVKIKSVDQESFNVSVDIAMKGQHGFLSAVDYPLLIFYAVMCGIYVVYAIAWLILLAFQWRDLLRIQFWIGGVILLGLMEKAVFYAEYQSINYTGRSVQGAILFAEILSCMKRTLARMLIIIVSLGFGIVKPRLGPMLHRVIGVGALYFILGTIEGCLRVLKPKTDPGNQVLMAGIPLALTDSAICYWIFSSLVQTNRTLRLRRNVVKLKLYRNFTNLLLLSVVGALIFMTWSIHEHKLANCLSDWKELWVDEAYWHFLFSVVLLFIMILWQPTNNNQRYAFTPLLDAVDDEEDDEENQMASEPYGMKMRLTKNNISPPSKENHKPKDEDLKWVEENIPSSLPETALPSLLDSDEEIMTAKFERSKME